MVQSRTDHGHKAFPENLVVMLFCNLLAYYMWPKGFVGRENHSCKFRLDRSLWIRCIQELRIATSHDSGSDYSEFYVESAF